MNEPGPWVTIWVRAAGLVVLADLDLAGEEQGQAVAGLADRHQRLALADSVRVSPNRRSRVDLGRRRASGTSAPRGWR